MTISPRISMLSAPIDDEPITRGTLAYLRARYRGNVHSLILEELERSGIANARLARRLRMDAGQLSRLLGTPSNMSLDTVCDLLFAIAGKEPDTKALLFGNMDKAADLAAREAAADVKREARPVVHIDSSNVGTLAPITASNENGRRRGKMDNQPPAAAAAATPRVQAPTYREIYINAAGIAGGGYDLLIIGLLTKLLPNGQNIDEEQVALRTSPQQFKSMAGMMLEAIFAYERDVQILKLPPDQAHREAMMESIRGLVTKTLPPRPISGASSSSAPSRPAGRSRGAGKKTAK